MHPSCTCVPPFGCGSRPTPHAAFGSGRLCGAKNGVVDRRALLELIKGRSYEEALKMLYEARRREPSDESLSRSIRHLKVRLAKRYADRLGGVDRILLPVGNPPRGAPSAGDERLLHELVDGIVSVADILESSHLGRLQTLRMLGVFVERGLVELGDVDNLELRRRGSVADAKAPSFEQLFKNAMDAYLEGNVADAEAGLEACLRLRPDAPRALHNLSRLRELKEND